MSLQWQQAGNIASSSFTSPIRFYLLLSPFPNSAHILYGKSLASVHGDIGDQILTGPRRELLSDTYLSGSFKCVYTIRNDVVFSSTQYQLLMTKLFSDYCTTISKQIWQKQSVIMELDCSKIPNARISRHGSSCSINVNFLSAAEGRLSFSFLNGNHRDSRGWVVISLLIAALRSWKCPGICIHSEYVTNQSLRPIAAVLGIVTLKL